MSVQKIDYPNNGGPNPDGTAPRIESGAVQFGNDWPGLFLRGDHAFSLAQAISLIEQALQSQNAVAQPLSALGELRSLREMILEDVVVK